MTNKAHDRRTIIAPEELIGAVNAALGVSMHAAGWQDHEGNRYAAASYLSASVIAADDLPDLPVVVFSRETPLALTAGHVHVVNGHDGTSALADLGLTAVSPDLP